MELEHWIKFNDNTLSLFCYSCLQMDAYLNPSDREEEETHDTGILRTDTMSYHFSTELYLQMLKFSS